ncbi:unnamed protein product [Toxocara canis]|uniref:DUF5683 domain-containing protein n=1 Tax=Toxocara canis TaxID=6265 RepID=A0A183V0Q2_TOXCA|nr:unnamed protein product [Toxocara canis]
MRLRDLLALSAIPIVIHADDIGLFNHDDHPLPSDGSLTPIQPFPDSEPQFLHIQNQQINTIHVPADQLLQHIQEKERQSWLVASLFAYSLFNGTFYSVNYIKKRAIRQRIFVDLTAEQLQTVIAEMTEFRLDPVSICVVRASAEVILIAFITIEFKH